MGNTEKMITDAAELSRQAGAMMIGEDRLPFSLFFWGEGRGERQRRAPNEGGLLRSGVTRSTDFPSALG